MNPRELCEMLLELETELMHPEVRHNRARAEELLDEEFSEIGSSGRVWSRLEILELLTGEQDYEQPCVEDFRLRLLEAHIALVTYRAVTARRGETLRSSIWMLREESWRCVFHQGTPSGL